MKYIPKNQYIPFKREILIFENRKNRAELINLTHEW